MISFTGRFACLGSNEFIRVWFFLLFACASFFFATPATHAGSLYFFPASGTYAIGKVFTVNVLVSTPAGVAANAYSGTVTYPTDKLEMTAIGTGGSIVSFWSQQPSFSSGSALFEGVTFSPGYTGGAGKIVSLTFRAKAAGTAKVRFSAGGVFANDGQATNILSGFGTAAFTITGPGTLPPSKPPSKPLTEIEKGPLAPVISSTSHPNSAKWYAVDDVSFTWDLQSGVDAVTVLIDQNPASDPGTNSDGLFSSFAFENIQDGIGYFHLRVRNLYGWSSVSHFKFQTDTKRPDLLTMTRLTDGSDSARQAFRFEAADSGSGIDHFEIQIDDEVAASWVDDGTHTYRTPAVSPGYHALRVRVFDKAGNFLEVSTNPSASDVWAWINRLFGENGFYLLLLWILFLLVLSAYFLWKYLILKKKLRRDVHGA